EALHGLCLSPHPFPPLQLLAPEPGQLLLDERLEYFPGCMTNLYLKPGAVSTLFSYRRTSTHRQKCGTRTALCSPRWPRCCMSPKIIPTEAPRGGVGPTKKAWKRWKTNRFQEKLPCWRLRTRAAEGIFLAVVVCLPGTTHLGCPRQGCT